MGYTDRDNGFYLEWDSVSRGRDTFTQWMRRHVLETADFAEHLTLLGIEKQTPTAA
jgi:hypothetical protein